MKDIIGILSVVLWGCGCTGESVIEKQNNKTPTISIASHSDGAEMQEGYGEQFRAAVSDDDNDFEELSVAWYLGDSLVCDWSVASPAGESICELSALPSDSIVSTEVRDPSGAGARAEISIAVTPTDAPGVIISTPLSGGNYYSDQLIQFSGIVSDSEDALSDLLITWHSSVDGDLPIDSQPDSSGEISDYGYLSEGQHAIELRVEDSSAKVSSKEVVVVVGGENSLPQCSINEPMDNTAVTIGDSVVFRATVTDDDIPANQLLVEWSSDKDGLFATVVPTSNGDITTAFSDLSANYHTITLSVTDEVGALCSEAILISVGNLPTVTINEPVDGTVFSLGETISFEGSVSDNEDLASSLSVSWQSSIDGEIWNQSPTSVGTTIFSTDQLSAGLHSIILSAVDTDGLQADDIRTVRINTVPTAPSISLSPDPIYSGGNLVATVTGSIDADGDTIGLTYVWLENSVPTVYTSSMIPSTELDVGELWTLQVTPNDGYVDGQSAEASIVVSNSLPSISSVLIVSSDGLDIFNDSVLTCTALATDLDETVSPTYLWTVNGLNYSGGTLDVSTTSAMPADSINCTASVSDSNGATDSASSTDTVANRAPNIASLSISPNTAVYSDSSLSCSLSSSDSDGEALVDIVNWYNGSLLLSTGSSLQLDPSIVSPGDSISCIATVTDGSGDSDTDTVLVLVLNSDPVVDSIDLSPVNPSRTETITCVASVSDVDGGSPTLGFNFLNQNTGTVYLASAQSSGTASVDLSATGAQPGDVVLCTVTVSDLDGGTDSATATVTLRNTAPEFTSVAQISPSTAVFMGTALTCTAVASDSDDGAITPIYIWKVDGSQVSAGASYTVADGTSNSVVQCIATATDSDGEVATSTDSVTISNTVPTLVGPTLSSSTAVNDDVLSCIATVIDPDEVLSPSYSWSINGLVVGSGSSLDLATTAALGNDVLSCTALVTDSAGTSDSGTITILISNRLPSAPVISISPSTPIEGIDDLQCIIDIASVDDDGDSIVYTYSWTVDGSGTSFNSNLIGASNHAEGETWKCIVTPSDFMGSGVSGFDSVLILSASQEMTSVSLPVTVGAFGSTQGAWFTDPLETLGAGKVWYMDSYHTSATVYEYNSQADFVAQSPSTSYSVPQWEGTGHIVYGGSLYYVLYNSNSMVKYNLSTQSIDATVTLTSAGYHNLYSYQWGGFSDIDFSADEEGLWVVYATSLNSGRIVISKLDPSNLSILNTWNTTSSPKGSIGNCWMVQGVMYCTDNYSSASTSINYAFDTSDGSSWNPNIPFKNEYGYNGYISYNHNEQKLYSWDNAHSVLYTVSLN